jgi:hypothetical protein
MGFIGVYLLAPSNPGAELSVNSWIAIAIVSLAASGAAIVKRRSS